MILRSHMRYMNAHNCWDASASMVGEGGDNPFLHGRPPHTHTYTRNTTLTSANAPLIARSKRRK